MARLRHSCSIAKTRTQSEGWSTGSPQVKGSAPGGASPSSSHTAPFPGYSCTASELAHSTTSQTLGGEMRFCSLLVHPGSGPTGVWDRPSQPPKLGRGTCLSPAAFPLYASQLSAGLPMPDSPAARCWILQTLLKHLRWVPLTVSFLSCDFWV